SRPTSLAPEALGAGAVRYAPRRSARRRPGLNPTFSWRFPHRQWLHPPALLARGHRHVSWPDRRRGRNGRFSSQPGKTTATSTTVSLRSWLGATCPATQDSSSRVLAQETLRNPSQSHALEPAGSRNVLTLPLWHSACFPPS